MVLHIAGTEPKTQFAKSEITIDPMKQYQVGDVVVLIHYGIITKVIGYRFDNDIAYETGNAALVAVRLSCNLVVTFDQIRPATEEECQRAPQVVMAPV